MGAIKIIIIGSVIILGIEALYFRPFFTKPQVLGQNEVVEASPPPEPTPEPTPLPTETSIALPKPTAKAETPIPQPTFTSQQINEFIDRFAGQYGVDPNVLRHIALCESDFRPNAKYVGYGGLFQFGPITWKDIRKKIGEDPDPSLRYNAEEAVQTAAYVLSTGKTGIWPNCAP